MQTLCQVEKPCTEKNRMHSLIKLPLKLWEKCVCVCCVLCTLVMALSPSQSPAFIYLFYNFIFKPIPFVRPLISTVATTTALLVFRPNTILCIRYIQAHTHSKQSHLTFEYDDCARYNVWKRERRRTRNGERYAALYVMCVSNIHLINI